jgi:hypothetical protein
MHRHTQLQSEICHLQSAVRVGTRTRDVPLAPLKKLSRPDGVWVWHPTSHRERPHFRAGSNQNVALLAHSPHRLRWMAFFQESHLCSVQKTVGPEQTKTRLLGTVPHLPLPNTVFVGRRALERPLFASVAPLMRRLPTMSIWNKYHPGLARGYCAARGLHSVAYRDGSMYH